MSVDPDSLKEELAAVKNSRDLKSFRYLLQYAKPYRYVLAWALFLLIFSSFTAVLSARVLGVLVEKGIKDVLAQPAALRSTDIAFKYGALIIFLELVSVASAYFGRRALSEASIATIFRIREKLFSHLQLLPMNFFDKQPLGRTVTRLTHDVEGIEDFFSGTLARLLSAAISLVIVLLAMLVTKPSLGIFLILAITPAVIVTFVIRDTVRDYNREMAHKNSTINARLWEFLNAIPVIRGFGAESWSQAHFDTVIEDHLGASIKLNVLNAWSRPVILILCQAPLFLLFWIGGHQVFAGTLSLGIFVTFIRYCERFSRPISSLAQEIHQIQTAFVNAERVTNFLNRPVESEVLGADGNLEVPHIKGEIEFQDVSMSYDPHSPKKVLSHLSFHVKAGEKIGLAGRTGSGKTTTLGLLARLYEFQEGQILIDSQSIKSFKRASLRKQIGYVSQDVVIFKGSLRENLCFGNNVPDAQIMDYCKQTGLLRVFETRGLTLDTEILDQGANFSFGERQLMALTRVLIKNPGLLVLDEATANIDPVTEELVGRAVNSVMKDRTCFIIAHRLATLKDCDRIFVFREGHLVESGNHAALVSQDGYYASLVKSGEQMFNPEGQNSSSVH